MAIIKLTKEGQYSVCDLTGIVGDFTGAGVFQDVELAEGIVAQSGMLLKVDRVKKEVGLPAVTDKVLLFAPVVKRYEEHIGKKEVAFKKGEGFAPRLFELAGSDMFRTNCVCWDSTDWANFGAVETALRNKETILAVPSTTGHVKLVKTAPAGTVTVLQAVESVILSNDEDGIKFIVA